MAAFESYITLGDGPTYTAGLVRGQDPGVDELDQIRMGGDQGLAPVDERVVRGEEIGDVAAFLVGHGVSSSSSRRGSATLLAADAREPLAHDVAQAASDQPPGLSV